MNIFTLFVGIIVGLLFARIILNSDFFEEYGAWIVGIGLLMLIVMFP